MSFAGRLRRAIPGTFIREITQLLIGSLLFLIFLPQARAATPSAVEFLLRQLFPQAHIELKGLAWEGPSSVSVREIVLRERASGETVFTAKGLRIRWKYGALLHRTIEEIGLQSATVHVNTSLLRMLQPAATGDSQRAPNARIQANQATDQRAGAYWNVRRFRCGSGQIRVDDPALTPFGLRAFFRFDWQDFGTGKTLRERLQDVVFWDIAIGESVGDEVPVAHLNRMEIQFSPAGLLDKKEIAQVLIRGGQVRADARLRKLLAKNPPPSKVGGKSADAAGAADDPFRIGRFMISDVQTDITEGFPGLGPGFAFNLNTDFTNIPLGAIPEELGSETQQIELAQIEILSPVDPLVRVLRIHSIFVNFTLDGLLNSRIERVVLLNPTVYLSQDLFLYMREMRESQTGAPDGQKTAEKSDGWVIEELRVEFGRLVLGGERIGQIGLPMSFKTAAENVRFNDLASLRLETVLEVEPQSFAFPALHLNLEHLSGSLRFSYPPEQAPTNLVNILALRAVRWRQFEGTDLWLSATFDSTGVFASFGGAAYGGYLNGGVSFFFGPQSRWLGWVYATGVDIAQLSTVISPKNVTMTGKADVRVEVDAAGSRIERVVGNLLAEKPGDVRISRLDDVIANLPVEWSELKRSGATVALETLRDFRYSRLDGTFWFVEGQGRLDLQLPGPAGSRKFTFVLHGDDSPGGRWSE